MGCKSSPIDKSNRGYGAMDTLLCLALWTVAAVVIISATAIFGLTA